MNYLHEKNKFDLADRTLFFSQSIRKYARSISLSNLFVDDLKQLIRAAGSVGANYIEAEDALSTKDFVHRIKICKKEAKETIYWLKLLSESIGGSEIVSSQLIDEASQLMRIFGKIITDKEKR